MEGFSHSGGSHDRRPGPHLLLSIHSTLAFTRPLNLLFPLSLNYFNTLYFHFIGSHPLTLTASTPRTLVNPLCQLISSHSLQVTKPPQGAACDYLHHSTIYSFTSNKTYQLFHTRFRCLHHPSYSDHKYLSDNSSQLPLS